MEGEYARRAFPCFDEPNFKATFATILWYQIDYPWSESNEYYALSNMPLEGEAECEENWCKATFQKSAVMSTYLNVYAIVDFGSVLTTTTLEDTPAELFARKEAIGERGQSIAEVGQDNPMWFPTRCTERITDRFGEVLRSYSEMGVPKADQIAIPDFNAGAMENWGLVTYREQSLLYDMSRDRFSRKEYVCSVVAHEMAHMWFGDFITCPWWDELWINEAFATYFSYVGLEQSEDPKLEWDPELKVDNWDLGRMMIYGDVTSALSADQTIGSNPIVNKENNGDHNVEGNSGSGSSSITYSKGGFVIKMMRCHLGDEAFFGGLQNYLEKFQYSNPTTQDLFQCWDDYIASNGIETNPTYESPDGPLCGGIGESLNGPVLSKSFEETFDPWVRQMGYPFLRVRYNEDGVLTIQQKRFLTNPDEDIAEPPSSYGYVWDVPLALMMKTGDTVTYQNSWLAADDTEQVIEIRILVLTNANCIKILILDFKYKMRILAVANQTYLLQIMNIHQWLGCYTKTRF